MTLFHSALILGTSALPWLAGGYLAGVLGHALFQWRNEL